MYVCTVHKILSILWNGFLMKTDRLYYRPCCGLETIIAENSVWWHHCIEIVSVLFFIYVNKWSNSCRFSRCNNFKVWMLMLFIKKMGKSMPDYGKFVNKILF